MATAEAPVANGDAAATVVTAPKETQEVPVTKLPQREKKAPKTTFQLKTPKGTQDWIGHEMEVRQDMFSKIRDVFRRHGAVELDTPVFELKEILAGKYGEDSKLIYDLQDQGGELSSLRYDLTVPLARYLAMNTSIQSLRRFHIGKVYRRDQPAIQKGRLREFVQCDIDFVGQYDAMIPDSEILRIVVEVFESLGLLQHITIKLNHRQILDGMFTVAGVPEDKIRTISSAVDKLDKSPWAEVKKEMLEKGLPEDVADRIGEYVKHSGSLTDIIAILKNDKDLTANEALKKGVNDMELLAAYLDAFGVTNKVSFDLSLARGLDYYTGIIYEVIFKAPEEPAAKKGGKSKKDDDFQVGSIAAGGRYDNLVSMYAPKRQLPCCGISFGVERIFAILRKQREREAVPPTPEVDVYVMAFGSKESGGMLPERMAIARELWEAGIRAGYTAKLNPKLQQQFKLAETANVPLGVIFGENELKEGKVRLKLLGMKEKEGHGTEEKEGRLIPRADLVAEVMKLLS